MAVLTISCVERVFCGPLANKFDPLCNASGYGQDPYPALYDESERGAWNFAFEVSPYYQDADHARNWAGSETVLKDPTQTESNSNPMVNVGIFEEHGAWNMLGIFYGIADEIFKKGEVFPAPGLPDFVPVDYVFKDLATGGIVATTSLPAEGGKKIKAIIGESNWTDGKYGEFFSALEHIAFAGQNSTGYGSTDVAEKRGAYTLSDGQAFRLKDGSTTVSPDLNARYLSKLDPNTFEFDEENFEKQLFGFFRPQPEFRRQGLRFKASLTILPGFKVWAKGGVCEYRVRPIPFSREGIVTRSATGATRSQNSLITNSNHQSGKKSGAIKFRDAAELKEDNKQILRDIDRLVQSKINTGQSLEEIQDYLRDKLQSEEFGSVANKALCIKIGEIGEEIAEEKKRTINMLTNEAGPKKSGMFSDQPTRTLADDENIIQDAFLNSTSMKQILDELDINADPYNEWTLEDTYVAADFAYPFLFRALDGSDVLKVWPTISVGAWIPTSKKRKATDPRYLFRIPVGNDEHIGICIDGAINLDFKDMITFNIGVGATIFDKKAFNRFPIKNHPKQQGIIPWTAAVERKLGDTLCARAGMVANNFIEGASAFFEYTYVTHREDKITIVSADLKSLHTTNRDALNAFLDQVRETAWSCQELHCGMTYQVTQNFELGASFKAHVKGENVPKVKTIMASMRIAF